MINMYHRKPFNVFFSGKGDCFLSRRVHTIWDKWSQQPMTLFQKSKYGDIPEIMKKITVELFTRPCILPQNKYLLFLNLNWPLFGRISLQHLQI